MKKRAAYARKMRLTAALGAAKAAADVACGAATLAWPCGRRALTNQRYVWVRVPVFGTDLAGLSKKGRASLVAPLGAGWCESVRRGPSMRRHRPTRLRARSICISLSTIAIVPTGSASESVSRSAGFAGGRSAKGYLCLLRRSYATSTGANGSMPRLRPDTYVRQRIEVAATRRWAREFSRADLSPGTRGGHDRSG
jgi:multidrug efflux system membrane fusion protein